MSGKEKAGVMKWAITSLTLVLLALIFAEYDYGDIHIVSSPSQIQVRAKKTDSSNDAGKLKSDKSKSVQNDKSPE